MNKRYNLARISTHAPTYTLAHSPMAVKFTAQRSPPELVVPARPTPREMAKTLSDADDCFDLRSYIKGIEFFRCSRRPGHGRPRPAEAIRVALAEALVYYYPIAGRLREIPGSNKLVVDCTADGVVFVEASTDVRLEELGKPPLRPPYPCIEELLCDVGDEGVVLGKPLFFIQVTQFTCGGFAVCFHACHNVVDAFGLIQFIKGIADLARGESQPTVLPVWERQILMARTPPCITHIDPAYSSSILNGSEHSTNAMAEDVMLSTPAESMVRKHLRFSQEQIAHLRRHILSHLNKSITNFELLTAVMWRCRTRALGYKADQQVRLVFPLNARGRWKRELPIPSGFYGNCLVCSVAEASVGELCGRPLGHTVELIWRAKKNISLERMRSTVDMNALLRGRPTVPVQRAYWVSDVSRIGDDGVDFGWAEWVGGGIMPVPEALSMHTKCRNEDGAESVVMCILLPRPAMDLFEKEIASWLSEDDGGRCLARSSL